MPKKNRYWVLKFYDRAGYECSGHCVPLLTDACWYETHTQATMVMANREGIPARPQCIEVVAGVPREV